MTDRIKNFGLQPFGRRINGVANVGTSRGKTSKTRLSIFAPAKKPAFTLVELLAVMACEAAMLGVLITLLVGLLDLNIRIGETTRTSEAADRLARAFRADVADAVQAQLEKPAPATRFAPALTLRTIGGNTIRYTRKVSTDNHGLEILRHVTTENDSANSFQSVERFEIGEGTEALFDRVGDAAGKERLVLSLRFAPNGIVPPPLSPDADLFTRRTGPQEPQSESREISPTVYWRTIIATLHGGNP